MANLINNTKTKLPTGDVIRVQMVKPKPGEGYSWISLSRFVVSAVVSLGSAWVVMVGLGYTHQSFPDVPALGYWPVFWMLWSLGMVAGTVRGFRTGWYQT